MYTKYESWGDQKEFRWILKAKSLTDREKEDFANKRDDMNKYIQV